MSVVVLYPMFAMVMLTFLIFLIAFATRIYAVRSGQMDARYFKHLSGAPTEQVNKTTRHMANLFEMPVLFYVACLLAFQLQIQGNSLIVLAWIFVAARVVQAMIHLGPNKVLLRMSAFIVGFAVLVAIWALIFCHVVEQ